MTVSKPNGLLNSKIPWINEIALQIQVRILILSRFKNGYVVTRVGKAFLILTVCRSYCASLTGRFRLVRIIPIQV